MESLKELYKIDNNKAKSRGRNNSKTLIVLLAVLLPIYLFVFVANFMGLFDAYQSAVDISDKCVYSIVVLTSLSSLFFIVISGNQMAMTEKDNDVLATLPIPERKIVSAKLITAMIVESFFEIYIGIAGLIAYIIVGNVTLNGILILLFAPTFSIVLPTVLFSFIILAVRKAIQKSKFKRAFELFGLVLMLIFIFAFSFTMSIATSSFEG